MKTPDKYDPEDIESLMLHKQFNELYPEEKEFVLRHLENEEEYESMRAMMLELNDIVREEGQETPGKHIKAALLKEFDTREKTTFTVWLNSLFISPRPLHRRPAFYGLAAMFIGIFGLIVFFNKNQTTLSNLVENAAANDSLNATTKIDSSTFTLAEVPQVDTTNSYVLPKPVKKLAIVEEVKMVAYDQESLNDVASPQDNAPAMAQNEDESKELIDSESMSIAASPSVSQIESNSTVSRSKQNKILHSFSEDLIAEPISTSSSMRNNKIALDKLFTAR